MSRHRPLQWDNVVAQHAIEWQDGPDGRAVLLVPRFRKGILARWLQPRLKRPHMKVNLDAIGSFVWRRMDGTKTFAHMVSDMREAFGEAIEPAEKRLITFYTLLHKDGFVELFTHDEHGA